MKKILVVGDVMIDVYIFGDVTRLSQEAPVPVVKYTREEQRAGAAANVAMNCKSMGGDVSLMSICGKDEYGCALSQLADDFGVKFYTTFDAEFNTIRKLRIIGKQQQIVRVDFDTTPSKDAVESFDKAILGCIKEFDIIVFSDYGKGSLINIQPAIKYARSIGKVVLIDPKGHKYEKYRGADLIKPNLDEMREMVGGWDSEGELAEKVSVFMERGDFGAVLLTRASAGMTLFRKGMKPFNVAAEARNVFDVTGAGDVSIAAFAVALTNGYDYIQAAKYASRAAGLSVERFGTVTINESEVFGL